MVAKAKTRAWKEFGEAMENDFQTDSKRFWSTIRLLGGVKRCTVNTMYGGDGALLTSTRDVVSQWGEYFKDLLNPTDTPSDEETELGSLDVGPPISEVAEMVKSSLVARPWGWMRSVWSSSRLWML